MRKLFPADPYHWLDANAFIQAKNGPYSFEMAPGFWRWLEKASRDGLIRSPMNVYQEIQTGTDELAQWAKRVKKSSGLFVWADQEVQKCFGPIALFVQQHYSAPQAAEFLRGADPWVIAHALENQGTVVTHEVLAPPESLKVKIPNICAKFGVKCMGVYDAFRHLGLQL
jgi:hypothetical protein